MCSSGIEENQISLARSSNYLSHTNTSFQNKEINVKKEKDSPHIGNIYIINWLDLLKKQQGKIKEIKRSKQQSLNKKQIINKLTIDQL